MIKLTHLRNGSFEPEMFPLTLIKEWSWCDLKLYVDKNKCLDYYITRTDV